MLLRRFILRLPGINHAKKFLRLETVGNLVQQFLQLCCGLGEVSRVVLRDGGLELAVKFLIAAGGSRTTLSE